jgi:hypothetical protein
MTVSSRCPSRMFASLLVVLAALLGVALGIAPVQAEQQCPNMRCVVAEGWCDSGGSRWCHHVSGNPPTCWSSAC